MANADRPEPRMPSASTSSYTMAKCW